MVVMFHQTVIKTYGIINFINFDLSEIYDAGGVQTIERF